MAGSYQHIVNSETGALLNSRERLDMLDADGSRDVAECLEELYGMIWFLAQGDADAVHSAQIHYRAGLDLSPGVDDD